MNNTVRHNKTRFPLNYVFISAFTVLFLVFLTITGFSYIQLINVQQALQSTTTKAIPVIIAYDNIADKSARLAIYTEQLSNASNPPALRIATKKVEHETDEIADLLSKAEIDNSVRQEFEAIRYELQGMANLVQQRLDNISSVIRTEREMYKLFDLAQSLNLNPPSSLVSISAWFDEFSQLTVTAGSLMSYRKLNQIRQGSLDIHKAYQQILVLSHNLPSEIYKQVETINHQFNKLVLEENGLIALRILQLRIEGRATGRGNFTEKLVSDFTRSINFKSATVSSQILFDASSEQQNIALQIQIITFFFIISICLFIFITWLLSRRVINRLLLLKRKVSGVNLGDNQRLLLHSEDEISDIAKSFEIYVDTIEQQKQELSLLALQDGLTKIANRRAFDQEFSRSFHLSMRHNLPFSVLLIDVDYFKAYNDEFGHGKGDEALVKIAYALEHCLRREIDFVARYGGEEFVCILPGSDIESTHVTGELLRKVVADLKMVHSKYCESQYLTISVGGATIKDFTLLKMTKESLLEKADKELYNAKGTGRNLVRVIEIQ